MSEDLGYNIDNLMSGIEPAKPEEVNVAPEPDVAPEPTAESEINDIDEYGNESIEDEPVKDERTYSQSELNERINEAVRERLARLERNSPQPQQQADNAPPKREDSDSEADWQAELSKFIENTVQGMTTKKEEAQKQAQEAQAHQAFEDSFHRGMAKFKDFQDVVSKQPFSDAMTMATRGMDDPASFVYAASKRAGDDLARIAKINDPYAQMREIGKLEGKLKANKPTTKSPRPLGKVAGDTDKSYQASRKSVDDLIRESDEKRLSRMNSR